MGPAVTSEADNCAQEKRLKSTASLSPLNSHSVLPTPQDMSSDEPGVAPLTASQTPGQQSEDSAPSAPAEQPITGLGLPTGDEGIFPTTGLNLRSVNIVNLADIHHNHKMSIYMQNNARRILPNGGPGPPIVLGSSATSGPSISLGPDVTSGLLPVSSLSVVTTGDSAVPCQTVASNSTLAKLVNSVQPQTGNVSAPVGRVHHTMIIAPKSVGPSETVKPESVAEGKQDAVCHHAAVDVNPSSSVTEEKRSAANMMMTAVEQAIARMRRIDADVSCLTTRLRRLQCREVNSAVKEEIGQAVSSLGNLMGRSDKLASGCAKNVNRDVLVNRDMKSLSTAELVSLVQKLQHSQHQGLLSHPSTTNPVENSLSSSSRLNKEIRTDLYSTSGCLLSNLKHLKWAVDSDATESSSGGESCDDDLPEPNRFSGTVSSSALRGQLESGWAKERANIISRWTWLQAQVSDLEYRIRQQNDIYRQLRQSKGPVVLRDLSASSATSEVMTSDSNGRIRVNRNTVNGAEDGSSEIPKSATASNPQMPNGGSTKRDAGGTVAPGCSDLRNRLCINLSRTGQCGNVEPETVPSNANKAITTNEKPAKDEIRPCTTSSDPSCRAARCCELRSWRRRTLLRTGGLHEVSRKAAQLSTIRCSCYPPVTPCALCGGRYNKVMHPGRQMPERERVALLDPSFHPVLSFSQDVSLPLRLTDGLWKGPGKPDGTDSGRHHHSQENRHHHHHHHHQAKPYSRPITIRIRNRAGSRSQSNDLHSEDATDDRVIERSLHTTSLRGQRSNLHSMDNIRRKKHLTLARKHLSKTSLRASSLKGNRIQLMRRGYSTLKDAALRRPSSRFTFDINNVVIPSHVTSATRVDILQYKEILTPKWRENDRYVETMGDGGSSIADRPVTPIPAGKRQKVSGTGDGESASKRVRLTGEEMEPWTRRYTPSTEPCGDDTDTEEEIENLSDEAFAARHLRHEIYEKKQFLPTISKQRRSRSNRSESDSFTLTFNPQSPDVSNHLDVTASLTSSTLSGGPLTSCLGSSDAEDPVLHHGDYISTLSRQPSDTKLVKNSSAAPWTAAGLTASVNSEHLASAGAESALGETRIIPTWPHRIFPLNDRETELLFAENPANSTERAVGRRHPRTTSPAVSSSSEDSSNPVEEDPNDPEWTVTSRHKDKPGIFLKIAKT